MAQQIKAKIQQSNIHKHITNVISIVGKENLAKFGKARKASTKKDRVLKDNKGTFLETNQKPKKGMKTIAE